MRIAPLLAVLAISISTTLTLAAALAAPAASPATGSSPGTSDAAAPSAAMRSPDATTQPDAAIAQKTPKHGMHHHATSHHSMHAASADMTSGEHHSAYKRALRACVTVSDQGARDRCLDRAVEQYGNRS